MTNILVLSIAIVCQPPETKQTTAKYNNHLPFVGKIAVPKTGRFPVLWLAELVDTLPAQHTQRPLYEAVFNRFYPPGHGLRDRPLVILDIFKAPESLKPPLHLASKLRAGLVAVGVRGDDIQDDDDILIADLDDVENIDAFVAERGIPAPPEVLRPGPGWVAWIPISCLVLIVASCLAKGHVAYAAHHAWHCLVAAGAWSHTLLARIHGGNSHKLRPRHP